MTISWAPFLHLLQYLDCQDSIQCKDVAQLKLGLKVTVFYNAVKLVSIAITTKVASSFIDDKTQQLTRTDIIKSNTTIVLLISVIFSNVKGHKNSRLLRNGHLIYTLVLQSNVTSHIYHCSINDGGSKSLQPKLCLLLKKI